MALRMKRMVFGLDLLSQTTGRTALGPLAWMEGGKDLEDYLIYLYEVRNGKRLRSPSLADRGSSFGISVDAGFHSRMKICLQIPSSDDVVKI